MPSRGYCRKRLIGYIYRMKKTLILLWLITCASFVATAQADTLLFNEGVSLKRAGKFREAFDKFQSVIGKNPGYTEAIYEYGWCQSELKDYQGALTSFRKIRNQWAGMAKLHFEMGYAFQQIDRPDSALVAYDRCLSINPNYSGVFKQKAFLAYNKDKFEEALDHFAKYEQLAKQEIKEYLYWYRKGYSLNALKKYTEAKEALYKSRGYNDKYSNTHLEIGFACTKLKQDDEAIGSFQRAIDLEPKSHVGYNGIAEVYRDNKKNMEEAMTWYRKTLSFNATERKANFGMGYCLNSLQKYAEAIPYLQQAVNSEKTYSAAYTELGYAYFKNGLYDDALLNLNKSIELNPKNQNPYYYATLLHIARGNKADAQRMVDELKRLQSRYADDLQAQVSKMP